MFTRLANVCLVLLRSPSPLTNYSLLMWLDENLSPLRANKHFLLTLSENVHLLTNFPSDQTYTTKLRLTCLKPLLNDNNIQHVTDSIRAYLLQPTPNMGTTRHLVHFLTRDLLDAYPDSARLLLDELLASCGDVTSRCLLSVLLTFAQYGEESVEALFSRVIGGWREVGEREMLVLLDLCSFHAYKKVEYLAHISDICLYATGAGVTAKSAVTTAVRCALISALVTCFKHEPVEYAPLLKQVIGHGSFRGSGSIILQKQVEWCALRIRQICCAAKTEMEAAK